MRGKGNCQHGSPQKGQGGLIHSHTIRQCFISLCRISAAFIRPALFFPCGFLHAGPDLLPGFRCRRNCACPLISAPGRTWRDHRAMSRRCIRIVQIIFDCGHQVTLPAFGWNTADTGNCAAMQRDCWGFIPLKLCNCSIRMIPAGLLSVLIPLCGLSKVFACLQK